MNEIETLKQEYFNALDRESLEIANKLIDKKPVTELILDILRRMYLASNTEKNLFNKKGIFECAYHPPVTSDFEFFIARIIYHYSKIKNLGWRVYLRRQSKNNGKLLAPDIRVEHNNRTLFIIEIKVKVGWIQYLFSKEKADKDKSRGFDADKKIYTEMERINLLISSFKGLSKENIFYLIPSLREAYREKYKRNLEDYKNHFAKHLDLNPGQILLLSNNPQLNLDDFKKVVYLPTNVLEKMFERMGQIE